jgi:hypothetical protein
LLVTYLDELVPARGDNDGVLRVGAEADARNPLGVALLGDGVLAVTKGVPQLDGAIARTGDDLSVVGREGDGENVVVVADESSGGGASGKLPEAESLVPRGGQGVGTVGGDDLYRTNSHQRSLSHKSSYSNFEARTYTVGDDVRVTSERSLGVTVLGLIAGEVPDDQALVSAAREKHVGARGKSVTSAPDVGEFRSQE